MPGSASAAREVAAPPTEREAPAYAPPPHLAGRALAVVPGALFAVVLAVGLVLAALGARSPGEGVPFLDGQWTARFSRDLDANIALREPSVAAWGAFEYLAFGAGRPGVLVGRDGWLYSDEEFRLYPDEAAEIAYKLGLVEAVSRHLAARGTRLTVALLPSKSRVYPEHLGRYRFPAYAAARHPAARAALEARGVRAPDLVAPLLASKADGPVFLRTDTHWTPRGARVVAQALADGLDFPGRGGAAWHAEPGPVRVHRGDLLAFVPMGPLAGLGPSPDAVETARLVVDQAPAVGLFDEVTLPVALVGTSYSKDPTWGFREALQVALGAFVLDAAQLGRGPVEPMLAYLENPAFLDAPPEVVIWEIPERFLAAPTSAGDHAELLDALGVARRE